MSAQIISDAEWDTACPHCDAQPHEFCVTTPLHAGWPEHTAARAHTARRKLAIARTANQEKP